VNHALATASGHRELREYYRAWLALRAGHPALGSRHKALARAETPGGVLVVTRAAPTGERLILAANLGKRRRPLPRAVVGARVLLDSRDARFGGRPASPLAPYQAVLFDVAPPL
jgi:hypothetical protein